MSQSSCLSAYPPSSTRLPPQASSQKTEGKHVEEAEGTQEVSPFLLS